MILIQLIHDFSFHSFIAEKMKYCYFKNSDLILSRGSKTHFREVW